MGKKKSGLRLGSPQSEQNSLTFPDPQQNSLTFQTKKISPTFPDAWNSDNFSTSEDPLTKEYMECGLINEVYRSHRLSYKPSQLTRATIVKMSMDGWKQIGMTDSKHWMVTCTFEVPLNISCCTLNLDMTRSSGCRVLGLCRYGSRPSISNCDRSGTALLL